MKSKNTKLTFTKNSITELNDSNMKAVHGGGITITRSFQISNVHVSFGVSIDGDTDVSVAGTVNVSYYF